MVLGTAIPLVMFLIWDAVILGTQSSVVDASGAIQAISDPLMRLRSASGIVGVSNEFLCLAILLTLASMNIF